MNLDLTTQVEIYLPNGTRVDHLDVSLDACRSGRVPAGTKKIVKSGPVIMVQVYKPENDRDIFTVVSRNRI